MGNRLYKTRQNLPKIGQKLSKMSSEWVISLSFRPPFVKIGQHVAQNDIYLVNMRSLDGPVWRDTISIDSIDRHNDTAHMRYEAYMSYYLSTPIHRFKGIL